MRSAVPLASVAVTVTIRPWRFSARTCPMCDNLASFPQPLAVEFRLGVGSALVRLVGPLLAVKVDVRITGPEAVVVGRILLSARSPHRSAGSSWAGEALDQGAIDAEVLAAQTLRQRLGDDGLEEGLGEAVRSSRSRFLVKVVASKASSLGCIQKPAEEKVEVNLLAQLAFAANRIEGHKQQRFEQSFWRHAGAAGLAVGCLELCGETLENAIRAKLDVAERVVRSDPIFDFEGMKQWQLPIGLAAHDRLPVAIRGV